MNSDRRTMTRAGYTLIETVLSLVMLSIIMASVGSAVLFASRAVPDGDSPAAVLLSDTSILTRITEDLAQAEYVIERTSTAVTVVVPDRDGDGLPDRIRYAWTNKAGDPLTYQFNSETAVSLVESVESFSLDYDLESATTQVEGAESEGELHAAYSYTSATQSRDQTISADKTIGQIITPTGPGSETKVQIDKVRISARVRGGDSGETEIEIQTADSSGLPTGTVLASDTMKESDLLSSGYSWFEAEFSDPPVINVGESVCVVLRWVSDSNSAMIEFDRRGAGTDENFCMLETIEAGATWQQITDQSMLIEVDVTPITTATDFVVSREHVAAITATIQRDSSTYEIQRRTQMFQAPPVVDQFWDADFSAQPILLDMNNDGTADWGHGGGVSIPDSDLDDGVWEAGLQLYALPTANLTGVIRINARMRAQSGKTLIINGPYHVNSGGQVLSLIAVLENDDSGGQALVIYNDAAQTRPVAEFDDLGDDWLDIRMTLLPEEGLLQVDINDEDYGSVELGREADQGYRGFSLWGDGEGAQVNDFSLHVGGTYVAATAEADGI